MSQRSNGNLWGVALGALLLIVGWTVLQTSARGQSISIPNTFVNGTSADANQVNANFAALAAGALNRAGGTMLGDLHSQRMLPNTDNAYDLGGFANNYRDIYVKGTTRLNGNTYVWPASVGVGGALRNDGANNLSWVGSAHLLRASSGSTSIPSPGSTLDSIALSGLNPNDWLRVVVTASTVTQPTAQVALYSDAVFLAAIGPNPLAVANPDVTGEAILRQSKTGDVIGLFQGMLFGGTRADYYQSTTPGAASFTNPWTLRFVQNGVTAGGQLIYSWQVYKMDGL